MVMHASAQGALYIDYSASGFWLASVSCVSLIFGEKALDLTSGTERQMVLRTEKFASPEQLQPALYTPHCGGSLRCRKAASDGPVIKFQNREQPCDYVNQYGDGCTTLRPDYPSAFKVEPIGRDPVHVYEVYEI